MAKYVSVERLQARGACFDGQCEWVDRYGEGNVVVTRKVLNAIERAGRTDWFVSRLDKTEEENDQLAEAQSAYYNAPFGSREEVRAAARWKELKRTILARHAEVE